MAVDYVPVKVRQSRPALHTKLNRQLDTFLVQEKAARQTAAAVAQRTSRSLSPSDRVIANPRTGRPQTSRMRSNINWVVDPTNSLVKFDVPRITKTNPYWIIQEIGTGQRATIKRAGADSRNPAGRPKKNNNYVVTVKRQRGRRISSGLVWGTGPRGTFMQPRSAGGSENLFPRADMKNAPVWVPHANRQMYIRNEIKGKSFVRIGAQKGFRQYRPSVLAAARQAFAGFSKS